MRYMLISYILFFPTRPIFNFSLILLFATSNKQQQNWLNPTLFRQLHSSHIWRKWYTRMHAPHNYILPCNKWLNFLILEHCFFCFLLLFLLVCWFAVPIVLAMYGLFTAIPSYFCGNGGDTKRNIFNIYTHLILSFFLLLLLLLLTRLSSCIPIYILKFNIK